MSFSLQSIIDAVREKLAAAPGTHAVLAYFSEHPVLFMLIILAAGLLTCFFGYRFFRVVISLCGAAAGAAVGYGISCLIGKVKPDLDVRWTVGIIIAVGIVGLISAFKLVKAGIFITCTYLTYKFIAPLFAGLISAFVAEKTGTEIPVTIVCLVIGLLVGLLSLALNKITLKVCTSVGGAYVVAEYSMLILISTGAIKTLEQNRITVVTLIAAFVFALLGLFVQLKIFGKHKA